jgi:hypothetical protein
MALVYFILSPRELFGSNNLYRGILIVATLACIFMTGSRTTIILFLVVMAIYFFIRFKIWFLLALIFLYLSIGTIAPDPSSWNFLPVHYRSLLTAIFLYGDLTFIASFEDRIGVWKNIYQNYILLRPSIGFGVTDSIGVADNQYIWMLASYGYIGTSIIFLYFGILLISMFFHNQITDSNIFYIKYVFVTFILFLIAGLTGQFFNVTQLIFLWFMIFGIYSSRMKNI